MTCIAMIPARMGSQRLKQKNLRELAGLPLIVRAIRKCKAAGVFDAIWVNSEHPDFGPIALAEGASFHRRPENLGSNTATSEQYVYEFLKAHPCDLLFQVHSIAPLLTAAEVAAFVRFMAETDYDAVVSFIPELIECALDGRPINFTYDEKTNSQDLRPIQRITWSITGWRPSTYVTAFEAGRCATYAGKVGYYPVDRVAGHVIKTEDDLRLAEALLPLVEGA
jgi:CMP-N-acetylneuraminic acid synthetase